MKGLFDPASFARVVSWLAFVVAFLKFNHCFKIYVYFSGLILRDTKQNQHQLGYDLSFISSIDAWKFIDLSESYAGLTALNFNIIVLAKTGRRSFNSSKFFDKRRFKALRVSRVQKTHNSFILNYSLRIKEHVYKTRNHFMVQDGER